MTESTVTLEDALKLLSLPRDVGAHPDDGEPIVTNFGRFGPYVKHGDEFRSLESDDQVFDIVVSMRRWRCSARRSSRAAGRRRSRRRAARAEAPKADVTLKLLDGRYGPYVTDGTTNASMPKGTNPDDADARRQARCSRRGASGAAAAAGPREQARAGRAHAGGGADAASDGNANASIGQVAVRHERRLAGERRQYLCRRIRIIGGGLAGSEAAWQAAARGVPVTLHEMRPVRPTAVHKTDRLAELVCSNSLPRRQAR